MISVIKENIRNLTTVGYRVQVEIDSFGSKHCHGLGFRAPGGQVKLDEVSTQVPFTVSLLSSPHLVSISTVPSVYLAWTYLAVGRITSLIPWPVAKAKS